MRIIHEPLAARRLGVLRAAAPSVHAALTAVLPHLIDLLGVEENVAMLADLLGQVAAEAPDAALALAGRLDGIPDALVDLTGLRKWAVHGLQRHRDDAVRRLHFFTQQDPLVFADRRTEHDTAHLLSRREALLHYLAGFGVGGYRIELHEPQAASLTPPSLSVGPDDVIRFPRRCVGAAAWQRDALYRAAIAHAAAHLRHSPFARPAGNRRPMLLAMIALVEDARVERLMTHEFPGLHGLWGLFHTAGREASGFELAGLAARLTRALHDPGYADGNDWVETGRRLFEEAAALDLRNAAAFERVGRALAIGIEKMRLALTADYRPQPAYRDDNTLLWDLNATLSEDERVSVQLEDVELRPRGELPPELPQIDVDMRRRTRYPEWDHRVEALRQEWATVIEPPPRARRSGRAPVAAPPRLRVHGQQRTPDRAIRLNKLAEGDELDLNAVVDNAIELRTHGVPDGRVFRRHGRRRRSSAVVVLMDLSASTGRFVPGSFTTVIDIEKRAARVVVDALGGDADQVALHGFASNGRHEVHYQRIKDFDELFGAEQQARLAQVRSGLSTRMGAALRHASAALAQQTADHKVIVMLTDGEPSDVDVVEDDYLVEDARHAVVGAAARGIRSFCVTLDRQADGYVRRIFGARNYLIADRAASFAGYTGQALVKLIAH
jgi:nitric oxide reductase NorD protein